MHQEQHGCMQEDLKKEMNLLQKKMLMDSVSAARTHTHTHAQHH